MSIFLNKLYSCFAAMSDKRGPDDLADEAKKKLKVEEVSFFLNSKLHVKV